MDEIKLLQRKLLATTIGTDKLPQLIDLAQKLVATHPMNALGYAREAESLATKLQDNFSLGEAYRMQGLYHYYGTRYAEALEWYDRAKKIHLDNNHLIGLGNTWNNIGIVHLLLTENDAAVEAFEKALVLFDQEQSKKDIAKVLNNLSLPCKAKGDYEMAMHYLDRCSAIYHELGDTKSNTDIQANKGVIYMRLKRYHEALEVFRICLCDYAAQNNRLFHAHTLSNIANCYVYLEDFPLSMNYHQLAIKEYIDLGAKDRLAGIYSGLGNTLANMGGHKEARAYYVKALAILAELNSYGETYCIVTHSMGCNALWAKDYEEAEEYLLKALAVGQEKGLADETRMTHVRLAELYAAIGEPGKSEWHDELAKSGQLVMH